jgi:hypothetical protein
MNRRTLLGLPLLALVRSEPPARPATWCSLLQQQLDARDLAPIVIGGKGIYWIRWPALAPVEGQRVRISRAT